MDITKVKKLSNHTLMIGHFEDEYNSSIKKIDVKKYIFLKKNKKENIEVEGRLLKLSITSNGNVGYESQVLFGNKKFDKIKHNNSKLSLAQIWSKPMSSSEVREIVGAFAGNSKRNALDFTKFYVNKRAYAHTHSCVVRTGVGVLCFVHFYQQK